MTSRAVLFLALVAAIDAFAPTKKDISHGHRLAAEDGTWNGEVAPGAPTGRIQGCQLARVGESLTDWEVKIDGNEADLAKFSEAVYKKITSDARQQRFQGFRPGTIPLISLPIMLRLQWTRWQERRHWRR